MTTFSAEPARLVDTSVAVPLASGFHPDHKGVTDAVGLGRLGLSGHAAFETFAVLSRLPGRDRRSPTALREQFKHTFPATVCLSAQGAARLLEQLAEQAIAGGAVYDALVGAAAVEHGMTLLTRDRRARKTYAALGVSVEYLGS